MKAILTLIATILVSVSYAQEKALITSIGRMHEGVVPAMTIVRVGKISISDPALRITKFEMSYVKEGKVVSYTSNSEALSKEMIDVLKSGLPSGTKLFFEAIEATDAAGKTDKVPGLALTIQ